MTKYFFFEYRIKHSFHSCLYILNRIIDDTIQTYIYALSLCCFFCSCIRTYVKSNDNCIRCRCKADIRLIDRTNTTMDHFYNNFVVTPMQALRKVILPEIRPGMLSGFLLALTISIDDFAVTVFTIGNQGLETLSTYIYADARKGGLTPELRPLSAVIFIVILALLIIINRRAGKEKKGI